jgi:hypothetical protein
MRRDVGRGGRGDTKSFHAVSFPIYELRSTIYEPAAILQRAEGKLPLRQEFNGEVNQMNSHSAVPAEGRSA